MDRGMVGHMLSQKLKKIEDKIRKQVVEEIKHDLLITFQLIVCKDDDRKRIIKKAYCHNEEEESWALTGYGIACDEFENIVKQLLKDEGE